MSMNRSEKPPRESKVVVFDLELNQPSEKIIELGYVIGDLGTGEIFEERSIVVNPSETLADEIIELTGITQVEVDQGVDLSKAYETLVTSVRNYGAMPILIQWGAHDALTFFKQLPKDQKWVFGRRWIDLKSLVQIESIANKWKAVGGLKTMARRKGIKVDTTKTHRADYDAHITFNLAVKYGDIFIQTENSRKRKK